jgi:Flp pilus assembly secretin CpaC
MVMSEQFSKLIFILVYIIFAPTAAIAVQCLEENVIFDIPSEERKEFYLCPGETLIVSSNAPIETVVLADENIVSINAISPQIISMMPLRGGETNIQIFGGSNQLIANMKVVVNYNNSNENENKFPNEATQENGSVRLITQQNDSMSTTISQGSNEKVSSLEIIINAGGAVISYDCDIICEKNER